VCNWPHSRAWRIGGPTLTATEYLFGVSRLLAICVPTYLGARAWRKRIAGSWARPLATLADLIGAISGLVVLSELLGSVGQFRRGPLIAATLVLGLGSVWWCGRERAANRDAGDPIRRRTANRPRPVSDVIVASASSALVASQWSTWVAHGLAVGVESGDSLWYHLPFAAAFVQSGWLSRLQYLNGEALVTYYPANTSVLHAVGILAMGTDPLSLLVNLVLVPVALLAGWCIGERAGVGPASLAGVAVALTTPVVVVSQSGTAKDDTLGIVGLLACIAFVVNSGRHSPLVEPSVDDGAERGVSIYSGLAAGLAIGSKLTLVAPILAAAISLAILTPARSRVATMLRWSAAAFATGGYWYLRNVLTVGNPLPGLSVGIGNVHLPRPVTPSMDDFGSNLLGNIANSRVIHDALLPGAKMGFGSAWPVIMIVVAAATLIGVATLRGRDLVAPLVGVVSFGAFLITPGTVWAPQLITRPGVRFFTSGLFAFNLRYMLPAVAIGLVTLPLVARRWRHGAYAATAVLGVALAATQLSPQSRHSWAIHQVPVALTVGVLTAAVMVILTSGCRWSVPSIANARRRTVLIAVILAILAIGVGFPVASRYEKHRFKRLELAVWADKLHGARIGYSGFSFSYPLYGAQLQNHVQMIGEHGPDGAWHPVRTCAAWRREVRRARVQYIVVPVGPPAIGLGIDLSRWRMGLPGGSPPDEPRESRWTRRDPGARKVKAFATVAIYAIAGAATTKGCS
jgi:hypothetical protein